ncbi:septal junction protein FraD [Nostoc sp. UHCC 0870]|uniref:septal junction protein FraD n=1 Tax=Nostoc sp. UHCC 0870 TaxID=2914041 RepID=UPI001EDF650E|nr:septal junction protein FraD [Nostoc sp. UHCC 0870]UKO97426.1 septal junction protein FraD [Nostoc sp. UHCC 0870]
MNAFLKDIFGIFRIFEDVYERLKKILIPPQAYSWQTLIYLSVFSGVISSFAEGYVRDIIALCGWLFLIAGTAWYTTDDPLKVPGTYMPVGAVITGFLVAVFAFGNQKNLFTPMTIVLWPTIAALITAIPEFIEGSDIDSKARIPKPEARQKIIILVGSCMVISCWLQFYFVIDKWLQEYPSLLADDFQNSTFVITREEPEKVPANGVLILNQLQPLVEGQISEKPWSQVERWLLEANVRVGQLGKEILDNNLSGIREKELWRIEPRVANTKSGYILDLLSIWIGPSSSAKGYFLKKSCRIEPLATSRNRNTSSSVAEDKIAVAEINCDRTISIKRDTPPPQQ